MKIFKIGEYAKFKVPQPDQVYRTDILTQEDAAKDLFGLFVVAPPGTDGQNHLHYHEKRESIFIVISGNATGIIDGKEIQVEAGDVIFIPPKAVHTFANRSNKDSRMIEFCTCPPAPSDFHAVPWK
jgi:mannose-6-phosphate isomerase-like protein (cupin superfamily)